MYELRLIIDEDIKNEDWIPCFYFKTYNAACAYGQMMVESGYEIKIILRDNKD